MLAHVVICGQRPLRNRVAVLTSIMIFDQGDATRIHAEGQTIDGAWHNLQLQLSHTP